MHGKKEKRRYWETDSYFQDEEDPEQSYLKIYATAEAVKQNKRKKLGITEKDMFRAMNKAHDQKDEFHGHLIGNVFYDKIQASGRGAGAQATRYVVATKKDGRYFILGFYKKGKQEYLLAAEINRYHANSKRLLKASYTDITDMLNIGLLFHISTGDI